MPWEAKPQICPEFRAHGDDGTVELYELVVVHGYADTVAVVAVDGEIRKI